MDTQAFNDARVARYATPDGTIEVIGGRDWARVHPIRCPCGRIFYGYAPLDKLPQPNQMDPEPPNGYGERRTCGHPICAKTEEEHQFHRRIASLGHSATT